MKAQIRPSSECAAALSLGLFPGIQNHPTHRRVKYRGRPVSLQRVKRSGAQSKNRIPSTQLAHRFPRNVLAVIGLK
jgi:hypothetical protein